MVSKDSAKGAEEDRSAFAQVQSGGIYAETFADEFYRDEGVLTKGEKVQDVAQDKKADTQLPWLVCPAKY